MEVVEGPPADAVGKHNLWQHGLAGIPRMLQPWRLQQQQAQVWPQQRLLQWARRLLQLYVPPLELDELCNWPLWWGVCMLAQLLVVG